MGGQEIRLGEVSSRNGIDYILYFFPNLQAVELRSGEYPDTARMFYAAVDLDMLPARFDPDQPAFDTLRAFLKITQ